MASSFLDDRQRALHALEVAAVWAYGTREDRINFLKRRGWEQTQSKGACQFKDPQTGKILDLVTAVVRQVTRELEPFRSLTKGVPAESPVQAVVKPKRSLW